MLLLALLAVLQRFEFSVGRLCWDSPSLVPLVRLLLLPLSLGEEDFVVDLSLGVLKEAELPKEALR